MIVANARPGGLDGLSETSQAPFLSNGAPVLHCQRRDVSFAGFV